METRTKNIVIVVTLSLVSIALLMGIFLLIKKINQDKKAREQRQSQIQPPGTPSQTEIDEQVSEMQKAREQRGVEAIPTQEQIDVQVKEMVKAREERIEQPPVQEDIESQIKEMQEARKTRTN